MKSYQLTCHDNEKFLMHDDNDVAGNFVRKDLSFRQTEKITFHIN